MAKQAEGPQGNPGDIANWPILKIDYRTDADKVAALLPPGIEPGAEPNVHLSIYNVPVPDEPEYGIFITVDADYRGTKGVYTLGYGIDQESAIFISRDMNGQPKFPCQTDYYRLGRLRHRALYASGIHLRRVPGQVDGSLPSPRTTKRTSGGSRSRAPSAERRSPTTSPPTSCGSEAATVRATSRPSKGS